MPQPAFEARECAAQIAWLQRSAPAEVVRPDQPYLLADGHAALNLAPHARDWLQAYFGPPRGIVWHKYVGHALSSQACCLNFLAPLATQPELLARVIGHALGIAPPQMRPVDEGEPWYVGFEWVGEADYLGEWPKSGRPPTRGANATSADAIVRYVREGVPETLLIEWKYTESYGAPLGPGAETRTKRYGDRMFAPHGPLKPDPDLSLAEFFWEPFYQLLRQQMLAWRMERAREGGAERVRVLHIAPAENAALHRITSPKLRERFSEANDAFDLFGSLLTRPDDFIPRTTEQVFGPFLDAGHADPAVGAWAGYLLDRYTFLTKA